MITESASYTSFNSAKLQASFSWSAKESRCDLYQLWLWTHCSAYPGNSKCLAIFQNPKQMLPQGSVTNYCSNQDVDQYLNICIQCTNI